jgi:hypothetical protein
LELRQLLSFYYLPAFYRLDPRLHWHDCRNKKFAMRATVLIAAVFLSSGILACDSDSPEVTSTTAVEDSALALEVLSAKGDSNKFGPVDDRVYEEAKVEVAEKKSTPPPKPKPKPAPVIPIAPRPALADVSVPLSEMPRPVKERPVKERPAPERPTKTGVISSGAALSLVTNQRVCSLNEGDTFHAVVVDDVRGSNGVAIPSGAQATAEITSASKWGAGLSVRVRSVRVDGKSYPVSSRVTYVLPEASKDDTCIPGRTRIDVRTTESVRLALN